MPTILWRSPYDMLLKNYWQFFKQINKVAKLTDVIFFIIFEISTSHVKKLYF